MLQWARAVVGIVSDVLTLGILFLRSSNAIRAENLVLRRQLARYIERGINPDAWIMRLASASHCSPDSSIGAMRSSSYDRRPSFAGTGWPGGSFGAGRAGRADARFRQNCAA